MRRSYQWQDPIQFTPPLNIKNKKVSSRHGLLIQENEIYAEVPFIEGLHSGSKESLEKEVVQWVEQNRVKYSTQMLFALSQINLAKTEKDWSKRSQINVQSYQSIESLNQLTTLKQDTVIKLKINSIDTQKELSLLRAFISQAPSYIKLRLDANQGLSIQQLLPYNELFKKRPNLLDYFEEPFLQIDNYQKLEKLQIPYALDESSPLYLDGKVNLNPTALVIKASIYGDLQDLLKALLPIKTRIILSSTYEGPVGLKASYWLCNALSKVSRPRQKEFHGLDTAKLH